MTSSTPETNHPDLWLPDWPWPETNSHKHKRGSLGVVTGPAASTGAARLAARAGLRIGAGLATLFCPTSATLVNAAHETAIMIKPFSTPDALAELASNSKCVLIGPAAGVDSTTRENTLEVLKHAGSSVLDADALTVFKDQPEALFNAITLPAVMTPHDGEFSRIFPGLLDQFTRAEAAAIAAARSGAVVLLKGSETLIAAPDGRLTVNRHASPFLATAGSGDVLAGMIAGLMAQGMEAHRAACAGAWCHGEVARRIGPGLISEDLPDALPGLLSEFYARRA
jgi:ADP-dependent NAD(P)H-hydrate dehydratase / NAD(P)H-hydrate epimerase